MTWLEVILNINCLPDRNISDLSKLKAHAGDILILHQTSPFLMCLQYKSFENTVGKGEIARNKQFLLFAQCFLPV